MGKADNLEVAFDAALTLVQRLISSGAKTAEGTSALPQLETLEREIRAQLASALERGKVDRDWFRKTVRWVVEWVPDDELTVTADTDREDAARLISKYNLLATPVVDDEGRMLGIVTVDDVLDTLVEEQTEEVQLRRRYGRSRRAVHGDQFPRNDQETSVLVVRALRWRNAHRHRHAATQ